MTGALAGESRASAGTSDGPAARAETTFRSRGRYDLSPRGRRWGLAAAATAIVALWSPVLWRLSTTSRSEYRVLGINDYELHVDIAARFTPVPGEIEAPHLLYHAITRAAGWIIGTPAASVFTLACAMTLTLVAVVRLLEVPLQDRRTLRSWVAMVLGASYFLFETPTLILLHIGWVDPATPFQTVHWWGNPTWLVGLPFAFLALPELVRAARLTSQPPPGSRALVGLLGLVVLGALAKPSFAVVLIPAIPVFLVLTRAPLGAYRDLGLFAVLPATAIVVWQTWFINAGTSDAFGSRFVFDPIVQPPFGWARAGVVYWVPLYVVVLAVVVTRGGFLKERMVQLVLVCTAFAVPLMLTVTEAGERAGHGNLAVPTQVCAALMFVLALRSCAIEVQTAVTRRSRWSPVVLGCTAVTLLFLAGGVLSLLDAMTLVSVPTDWFAAG